MRSVRRGVFETNSSSTHSLSINEGDLIKPELGSFNEIPVYFDEYGWEYEKYRYWQDKISYLLTMILETEANDIDIKSSTWIEEFKELDGYKLLDEAVYDFAGIHISIEDYRTFESRYRSNLGYIDHQSCDYCSLQDFLDQNNVDITDLIFNEGNIIITDNDNH